MGHARCPLGSESLDTYKIPPESRRDGLSSLLRPHTRSAPSSVSTRVSLSQHTTCLALACRAVRERRRLPRGLRRSCCRARAGRGHCCRTRGVRPPR
eukprot:7150904-Prymnesium_polylepis.1